MKSFNLLTCAFVIITLFANAQTPITDANFHQAIETCLSTNPVDGLYYECEYGAMPDWDVSNVTQMDSAFYGSSQLSGD